MRTSKRASRCAASATLCSYLVAARVLAQPAPVLLPPAATPAPTQPAPVPAQPAPVQPVAPGTVQYPPNAYPPNTYPPGTVQYPPNAYPPNTYPPGTVQYPPNAYPPNTYPPGTYPPGTYPPGTVQYPPNAYPPGTYPPGAYPPGTYPGAYAPNTPPAQPRIVLTDPSQREEQKEPEELPHRGIYSRFTLGFGAGHFGNGSLPAKPGFKPVRDLDHTAPVLSLATQLGGGSENTAIAFELLYEQTLMNMPTPSEVAFHLFGIGLVASYYMPYDLFLTGHLRWVGMILRMPDCLCLSDKLDSTSGPGLGLTLGKEWFAHDEGPRLERDGVASSELRGEYRRGRRHKAGIGLALQGNYARFMNEPKLEYVSGQLLLTVSHF